MWATLVVIGALTIIFKRDIVIAIIDSVMLSSDSIMHDPRQMLAH